MSAWAAVEDLIWLFEVEPQIEDDDVGYPVVAATFTTTRGQTLIECTLEPSTDSISLRWAEQGQERLQLHLWGIVDAVCVDRDRGHEGLVVVMIETLPLRELRIWLRPSPRISWESIAPWAPDHR